ncbi:hypothetical protein [Catelliglobosispora koreensis]|uniref:hypothetical protein n=1 Tax=Catelliglobosispora koreensis TaxID=129052 RepID=UPI0003711DB8|nr:hypothetical protein [Catelliglobosispora koreensis]
MPTRSILSQPVVPVVAAALVFANGIVNALPGEANLSDLQKLLLSGGVAVVSWLLTLGVEKVLANRSQATAAPVSGPQPLPQAPASVPSVMFWAGVAFLPAAIAGSYWIGAKVLATLWDLFGADLPATIRDLDPGGSVRSRELLVTVSVLFVVAHGIAAAAMLKTRDLAALWCSTGMARTGASIAAVGHLTACVLWATCVAQLTMPITVFSVAYAAIMLIVVTGRLLTLWSSKPATFADWMTVACFGLLTPVLQMLEVLSWPMFVAWIRRRSRSGAAQAHG